MVSLVFAVPKIMELRTLTEGGGIPPTPYPTRRRGSLQSMQDILTTLVALTLKPQQGQAYFLVLEVLPVPGMLGAPLWVPVPVIWKPACSFLFRRISVNPFFSTNSRRLSEGAVFVQPYFLSWSIKSPCASAEALKRLLW